jgi:signal transduction histidine kinase
MLSNAIKFAPKHSAITVSATQVENQVRVEIHDKGPGIPREKQSRLFSKFSQLEQPEEIKKPGSGLGLYICKTLINVQSGSVGVDSSEDSGTCFWFSLPCVEHRG